MTRVSCPPFSPPVDRKNPSLAHAVEKCIARAGAIGNEWLVSHGCNQDAAKVGWAGQDRDGCHGVSQDSTLACCAALSTSTRSQSGGCCQWVLPAAEPCVHDASQGRTASSQSDGGRRAGAAGRGCTNMHEGGGVDCEVQETLQFSESFRWWTSSGTARAGQPLLPQPHLP